LALRCLQLNFAPPEAAVKIKSLFFRLRPEEKTKSSYKKNRQKIKDFRRLKNIQKTKKRDLRKQGAGEDDVLHWGR
jgi:hypothetical protein